MKKHNRPKGIPFAGTFRRLLPVTILLVTAFVTIGVVAAISKQRTGPQDSSTQKAVPATNTARTFVRTQAATGAPGAQTAQVKPLTQEQAEKLAAALKVMANQSTDGLVSVQHSDGSVSMDLQGRFQNVVLAKRNEDGTIAESCVDNPEAGAAFFGIDPALVGVESKKSSRTPRKSSANK